MRRMIPGILIEKIKNLFTSLWSDDEGNVEVGKELKVDGNASLLDEIISIDFTPDLFASRTYPLGIAVEPADQSSFDLICYNDGEFISALSSDDVGGFFKLLNSDGTIKTQHYLLDANNWSQFIKLYRHHLTLTTANGTDCQDYYSHSNLVVDSIQDLTTITGGHPFGTGTGYVYASSVWKHGTANVTAVSDDVQLVTN